MPGKNKIILCLLPLFVCALTHGQSLSQQKEKRSRIEKDIEILRQQISGNASQSSQALSTISLLQAQQETRARLLAESDREIADLDRRISVISRDVRRHQEILDTLESHYSRLVMGAYKNRDIKLWYMYVLSSDSISQAFRRFGYFKNLSAQISEQAQKVGKARRELDARKAELLNARNDEKKLRNERAKELERLKADEKQQKQLLAKLKKDNKAYQASLRSKQAEMKAIDRQIFKMLAQATSGQGSSGKKTQQKPVDYVLDKNFENNKGKLPWPVEGPVTEHYGAYMKMSLFNNGIHIACEKESPVRCVFDGVVSSLMVVPGYGQCVLVQHGAYYTSYNKVNNVTVAVGDKVTAGQIIGEVSTIAGKTQLYFLVFKKKFLDPEIWLRKR